MIKKYTHRLTPDTYVAKTLVALALCAALAPGAHAQPIYEVEAGTAILLAQDLFGSFVGPQPAGGPATSNSDTEYGGSAATATYSQSVPILTSVINSTDTPAVGLTSSDSAADAGSGGVHASATAQANYIISPDETGGSGNTTAEALASAVYDDFVITGPPGASCVDGSANLSLSGSVFADGNADSALGYARNAIVIDADAGSGFLEGTYDAQSQTDSSGALLPTSITGTGALAGGPSASYSTSTSCLPVGVPFQVDFELAVYSQALAVGGSGGGSVDIQAVTDFSDTFGFSTVGPAFDLPTGYTVNSAEAGIINNVFTLGSPPTTTVPEPASLSLFSIGLTGLWALRARRQRTKLQDDRQSAQASA